MMDDPTLEHELNKKEPMPCTSCMFSKLHMPHGLNSPHEGFEPGHYECENPDVDPHTVPSFIDDDFTCGRFVAWPKDSQAPGCYGTSIYD